METLGIKAGRTWSVGSNGITSLKRTYLVKRDTVGAEETSFVGVPAINTELVEGSGLYAVSYDVTEGSDASKEYLEVTVTFSRNETALDTVNRVPRGHDIQSWGWRHGSVTRDLTTDRSTGNIITNSAGQPFDSAPQYEIAAPILTKVVKTVDHKNWLSFANCVNKDTVTINGVAYPARTLRVVQVDEEKLWDDEFGYQWLYTIGVQVMHNSVVIEQKAATDIGWDVAITDAGCSTLENGKLSRISWIDAETKKVVYATTPQLLNGQGGKLTGDQPYNFRFQLYPEAQLPDDFFSNTPTRRDPENQTA